MAAKSRNTIEIENINVPGQRTNVDANKYLDMKQAMLRVLPQRSPGLSHKEIQDAVLPYLSEALFPAGEKRGWWSKTVQLDLEAKKVIRREQTKPLRWYKTQ